MASKAHLLLSLAVVLLAASIGPALAARVTLTGEVTYRERIALPPGASLKVRLIDLSAPGTPTRVEAAAPIASPGQVPLTFTLNFDDGVLNADHQHALVAEISAGIELWFRNAEPYKVNPLAPETPVMIVANFVGRRVLQQPTAPQPEPPTADSILDVNWRATHIGGVPVAEKVESTLSIAGDMRAGGRGGCNSYFAQASIDGESLRFSAIGATMMACLSSPAEAQEAQYFAALEATRFWRTAGDQLLLLDAGGTELVRFARAAF